MKFSILNTDLYLESVEHNKFVDKPVKLSLALLTLFLLYRWCRQQSSAGCEEQLERGDTQHSRQDHQQPHNGKTVWRVHVAGGEAKTRDTEIGIRSDQAKAGAAKTWTSSVDNIIHHYCYK